MPAFPQGPLVRIRNVTRDKLGFSRQSLRGLDIYAQALSLPLGERFHGGLAVVEDCSCNVA